VTGTGFFVSMSWWWGADLLSFYKKYQSLVYKKKTMNHFDATSENRTRLDMMIPLRLRQLPSHSAMVAFRHRNKVT
jgi:hypothetical protein